MPFGLLLQVQPPTVPGGAGSAESAPWPPPKADDGPPIVPVQSRAPAPRRASTAAPGQPVAPAPGRAAAAPTPPPPDARWLARVSFGLGQPNDSGQTTLLKKEGYSLRETSAFVDGGGFVKRWLGLGGFVGYATTTGEAESSPGLNRWSVAGGVEAVFATGDRGSTRVLFTPRVGLASGKQDFGGRAGARTAPYVSATFDVLPFVGLIGIGLWVSYAPASAPGAAGRRDDLGGFGLQLTGSLDG